MYRWLGLTLIGVLTAAGLQVPAVGPTHAGDEGDADEVLFSKARILIEFNASDEDVGVQVLLDGDPWKQVRGYRPDGRLILDVMTRRGLREQGLSEFFFESSEPSLAIVSLEEFLDRFPEGVYEFEGRTTENDEIEGEAILTHVIPAGAEIVSPLSSNDELPVVDPDNFVVEWEQVEETIDGSDDIEIVGYQVIVEQVEPLRVYSVHLPASATSVSVPPEFFEQTDTIHKFEVLAIEAGGNQTITSGEFLTEP